MRNYRIVRIAGLHYNDLMFKFYANDPGLKFCSYSRQQKTLFDNSYIYSDSFTRNMKKLGHDAHEIVYDLKILQQTWAKEHGIRFQPQNWQHEILFSQIKFIKPDIIFFQDILSLPYGIRKELKSNFPFLKLIIIYRGYPGLYNSLFKELSTADVLLAGSPILVSKAANAGLKPYLVYHSFDDTILDKLNKLNKNTVNHKYDCTFAGSSGYGYDAGHQQRYWSLVELIKKSNIELWIHDRILNNRFSEVKFEKFIYSFLMKLFEKLKTDILIRLQSIIPAPFKLKRLIRKVIDKKNIITTLQETDDLTVYKTGLPIMPLGEVFPNRCHPPVFGLDMYKILSQSKITVNKHSNAAKDTVDNIRMFQATGVGTCLLTDTGKNMPDLFEEDREVVTYSSVNECIEKMNYLLDHDNIRNQIAKAGQKRTLKDHTTQIRCQQIDEILQKHL